MQDAWQAGYELGYKTAGVDGRTAWGSIKDSYDDTTAVGTWTDLSDDDLAYLALANKAEASHPEGSKNFLKWHYPSQPYRLRASKAQGGKGCDATLRRIAQVAFNIGNADAMDKRESKVPNISDFVN